MTQVKAHLEAKQVQVVTFSLMETIFSPFFNIFDPQTNAFRFWVKVMRLWKGLLMTMLQSLPQLFR
ncbi:hypothetical protein N7467_003440 [Penicillium canescens]|nr:hypothetical protein N7467_003440 [Penicillium canescens]